MAWVQVITPVLITYQENQKVKNTRVRITMKILMSIQPWSGKSSDVLVADVDLKLAIYVTLG